MVCGLPRPTVLASFQRQLAQGKVGVRGSGDDDKVNRGVLDQLLSGAIGLHTGMVLLGIIVGLGRPLHDRVELQLRNLLHEGNMKDLGTEAVADNADIPGLGGHDELIWYESMG